MQTTLTKRELAGQSWDTLRPAIREQRLANANLPIQWARRAWAKVPRDVQKGLVNAL